MEEAHPNHEKYNNISLPCKDISLQNLHKLFIKQKFNAEGFSTRSVKNYEYNFQLLLSFKPDISLSDLNEETMIHFFDFLNTRLRKVGNRRITRSLKNSSIATVRGKLNSFFKWLLQRGYLDHNPFQKIKYPTISHTDPRAFTPQEFQKICHAINTTIQWQSLLIKKRNIAMIMFLLYTGLRKEEFLKIQLNDVDVIRKEIVVRSITTKSKRSRIIPMNSELIPYLQDYLNYRKDYKTPFFWVSGTRDREFTEHGGKHLLNILSKVTDLNIFWHAFRHTFAVSVFLMTNDILSLQKLMGHRKISMTATYLRSIPEVRLVEQIKKVTLKGFFEWIKY